MCKHDWVVIVNEYEKSSYQKTLEMGKSVSGTGLSSQFLLGKRIIILQCTKCGMLDKTIESV